MGPHAHGNAARHVVDDLDVEESGRQKPSNDPHNDQHPPQCAKDWAPRTRKRHQQEHRLQRPSERSDPTQHAKGRTGDCPGPHRETATGRHVTQGGGGGLSPDACPLNAVRPPKLAMGRPLCLAPARPCLTTTTPSGRLFA